MLVQTSNAQNKSFLPVETCFLCLRELENPKGCRGTSGFKNREFTPRSLFLFGVRAPIMHTSVLIIKKIVPPIEINKKKCTPQPQSFNTMLWNNLLYFEHSWGVLFRCLPTRRHFFQSLYTFPMPVQPSIAQNESFLASLLPSGIFILKGLPGDIRICVCKSYVPKDEPFEIFYSLFSRKLSELFPPEGTGGC